MMNTTIIITSIIRSATVCKGEQQNLATAFLDGSQIYGVVSQVAKLVMIDRLMIS